MLQAIGSPRYRAKSLLFYGTAVNQAFTERAFFHSLQGVLYLVECCQIDVRLVELPVFFLVSDAGIAPVARLIAQVACFFIRAMNIL